ncbi:MAG: antitoxin [Acidobacteria bacterium]|nr:antitoxin [Acidobacteriota bacterium]
MRSTLDIAEDILLAVKERARRQRRSAGEVLSDLARETLTRHGHAGDAAEPEAFHGFQPLPRRGAVISNEMVDRFREEELD